MLNSQSDRNTHINHAEQLQVLLNHLRTNDVISFGLLSSIIPGTGSCRGSSGSCVVSYLPFTSFLL